MTSRPGAPSGNANAQTHGAYARPRENGDQETETGLAARIADLDARIARLGRYIDAAQIGEDGMSVADYAKLAALHGQLCSRLGRLLRDQQQLAAAPETGSLDAAIDQALSAASKILGVDL